MNIEEIEKTAVYLLSAYKASIGDQVELKNNFYWDIPIQELYNPCEDPKNLVLGQLSSDLADLQKLRANNYEFANSDYLRKVASLLFALCAEYPIAF